MNMASRYQPVDYLVVGHVTEDITPEGKLLGGTVTYAGLTAHAFGKTVGILTAAGPDTSLKALKALQVVVTPSESTCTFQNTYQKAGRSQVISAMATALTTDLLPTEWAEVKILHCGPVANEVDPRFGKIHGDHLLCLTPQGWLRKWDHSGRVSLGSWGLLDNYLVENAIVVLSLEDIGGTLEDAMAIANRCQILAVTLGSAGAMVYHKEDARLIPAPAIEEIDPTGCGDIFAASFFICLEAGDDPWTAAAIANRLAANAAERKGLESVPKPHEIKQALKMRSG